MKKLNLGFGRYSDSNLLVVAQAILAAMTGNVFFPSPPSLATLQTAINDYATALSAAQEGGKTNVATKNAKKNDLITVLVNLGNYVAFTAAGDLVAMISSGIPTSKTREPIPPLETPIIAKLEDGVNSGEIRVIINAMKGVRTYICQYTQDPITESSEWISQSSTLSKIVITGLEIGKRYWFRVIAYGNNEQEVYSDAVLSRVIH